jgi:pyruvate dehydrogenase E1 component
MPEEDMSAIPPPPDAGRLALYESIRNHAAFCAVSMIDWANHKPANRGQKPKIGGHQASSLSSADLLCAIYLHLKRPQDRVAVKPHAAPLLYSLGYLMGLVPEEQMGRLREMGGPQPYPTKTKDPVLVDYTTSSEALGVCATIYDAYGARYQSDNAARLGGRPVDSVYYAHCGDGELTEGQIDESLYDAGRWGLDNLVWIVDLNRQSLDRVMDDSGRLEEWAAAKFLTNGWHVIRLRWGSRLEELFDKGPEGAELRRRMDSLSDAQYQSLILSEPPVARRLLAGQTGAERPEVRALEELFAAEASLGADEARGVEQALAAVPDDELLRTLSHTGGHDIGRLILAFEEALAVEGRPVCIVAHTVKGHGSALAAHPENHGALMSEGQVQELRRVLGVGEGRFPRPASGSREAALLQQRASECFDLSLDHVPAPVSVDLRRISSGARQRESTGEAFQSLNLHLMRSPAGPYLAFGAPDVGQTTHLGPVIRQTGVYSPAPRADYFAFLRSRSAFAWRSEASGQFHSLGIAEGNAMLWAYAFGRRKRQAEGKVPLLTVVTVYDKFFERALNQLDYAVYSDARFVAVGVPSGTGLSRETGTHQSVFTPRIVMDLPGIVGYEPAFAEDVRAIYLWALSQLWDEAGEAVYLRLSTQPFEQPPPQPDAAEGAVKGAYWVRRAEGADPQQNLVHIFATGRKVPQALEAAERLEALGIGASVLNVTSYERLWREWDAYRSDPSRWEDPSATYRLAELVPDAELNVPLLIVGDFAPSVCEWVPAALGRLGDHRFLGPRSNSQAGDLESVDRYHGMSVEDIVSAAEAELRWRRRVVLGG